MTGLIVGGLGFIVGVYLFPVLFGNKRLKAHRWLAPIAIALAWSGGAVLIPVTEAAQQDAVFVGRVREDLSSAQGVNLWIVADNVRKGAALNSIQIAENLIKSYL